MIAVSKVWQRSFGITDLGLQAALVVVQKMISGQRLTRTIMSTGSSCHPCVTSIQAEVGVKRTPSPRPADTVAFGDSRHLDLSGCTETNRGRASLTRRDLTHRVTMKAKTPVRRP